VSRSGAFETTEFRRSFSLETDQLLRRRLAWFASLWGGLGLLGFVAILLVSIWTTEDLLLKILFGSAGGWKRAVPPLGMLIWLGVYGTTLFFVLIRRNIPSELVLRISLLLIITDGLFSIAGRIGMVPGYNLSYFWLAHLIACMVFPWTVRQALIPIGVVLGGSFLSRVTIEQGNAGGTVAGTIWMLAILSPGVILCGIRHTQRVQKATNRFLHQRYGMLRQELAYARQVHEALFPQPKADGLIRFSYRYEPMRQIGGDYLYTHTQKSPGGGEVISAVILDVTGHGIPAALTVNRLHGEIDLRFAEQPDLGPGELLRVLNRYIALTLAKHSIFATAVCFRIDSDAGTVRWASGGHPPAFIRGIDGTLRDLDPTSFVLGACQDRDFDPAERCTEFHEGDSLIAYTDGAIEARSIQGKMLKIDGLRQILCGPPAPGSQGGLGTWSERILTEVTNHRGGLPPEDDTLAIEIFRAIRVGGPLPARADAHAGVPVSP
jgi:serine phosphatase RsbU (regulator of sigma subunit)